MNHALPEQVLRGGGGQDDRWCQEHRRRRDDPNASCDGRMIRGIGVDLVEVERMAALLRRHGTRAVERLFTPSERDTCGRRKVRQAECYAARFAAKEAALKALGTGLSRGISWRDVEVLLADSGDPELHFHGSARARLQELVGSATSRVYVSLAHEARTAVAFVVIETTPAPDSD